MEVRLDPRQRRALFERFDQLRKALDEPLSDQECLMLLLEGFFVGPDGLLSRDEPADDDDVDGVAAPLLADRI
jgi:hypothetical protein